MDCWIEAPVGTVTRLQCEPRDFEEIRRRIERSAGVETGELRRGEETRQHSLQPVDLPLGTCQRRFGVGRLAVEDQLDDRTHGRECVVASAAASPGRARGPLLLRRRLRRGHGRQRDDLHRGRCSGLNGSRSGCGDGHRRGWGGGRRRGRCSGDLDRSRGRGGGCGRSCSRRRLGHAWRGSPRRYGRLANRCGDRMRRNGGCLSAIRPGDRRRGGRATLRPQLLVSPGNDARRVLAGLCCLAHRHLRRAHRRRL